MKKSIILFLALLLMSTFNVIAEPGSTTKYIPESSNSVVLCKNMQGDEGLKWIYNTWINSPRDDSVMRHFVKTVGLKELSVAVFPPENGFSLYMIIVLEIPADAKINPDLLNTMLLKGLETKGAGMKSMDYKSKKITYVHNKPVKDELSAYCIIDNIIVLATDPELLKKAIDGPAATESAHYKDAQSLVSSSRDCFYFAENSEGRFAQFLQPLEKKWKLSLLLSVEDLLWLGSSFDIVDSNKATGEIIFTGADKAAMDDIVDDAEFIGEAFKRKFTAEKINYTGVVDVAENKVKLTFQIEGLEPLWTSLFKVGVINTLISN
ncbi:MAG: hypothetical protein JXJ04_11165 [Spirochaetales bacterium]|nr:hypothetical protein [Spirochaetales bacterium]